MENNESVPVAPPGTPAINKVISPVPAGNASKNNINSGNKFSWKSKWPFLVIIILLILLGAFGAYFLMTKLNQNNTQPSPTPTTSITSTPTSSPTEKPSPSNISLTESFTSDKLSDISFSGYKIMYPSDWVLKEDRDESVSISTVTLTKQGYTLKIYQAATGGAGCIYEGDMPEGPASDFRANKYVDLVTSFATLRQTESPANGKMSYTYCQKNTDDGSFGQPTSIGHMSVTTGVATPDSDIVSEIEEIVKSIKTL